MTVELGDSEPGMGDRTVTIKGLPDYYGTRDIVPIDGKIYLYLPDGDYAFTVDGVGYSAKVKDAAATASADGQESTR